MAVPPPEEAARSDDPRVALVKGDVTTRAAAARALARDGTWEDLELIVERAKNDGSPSVRLYTAAAAADIVARLRGTGGQANMTAAQAQQIHNWVRTFDPGTNPSLLMMLSAVADQAAVDRLMRMMRDPRNGVRAGAATALRRMALSAAAIEDTTVPGAVRRGFSARRMPPDMILELIKLVGETGFQGLESELDQASTVGRPHGPAVDQVLERLAQRRNLETWAGLWWSDGSDVLETVDDPEVVDWFVVTGNRVVGPEGVRGPLRLGDPVKAKGLGAVRMVWVPRVGQSEQFMAIQARGHTYYRRHGKELVQGAESLAPDLGGKPDAARDLAGLLEAEDGAAATRVRGIVLWRAGLVADAREPLESLARQKRCRADVYWILAQVCAEGDDLPAALEALDSYLGRAGKRAQHRKEAEAMRARLSG